MHAYSVVSSSLQPHDCSTPGSSILQGDLPGPGDRTHISALQVDSPLEPPGKPPSVTQRAAVAPQPVHGTPHMPRRSFTPSSLFVLSQAHPLLNIRIPCSLVSKPLLTLRRNVALCLTTKSHLPCKAHCSQERSRKLAILQILLLFPAGLRPGEPRVVSPRAPWCGRTFSARGEGCSLSESQGEH